MIDFLKEWRAIIFIAAIMLIIIGILVCVVAPYIEAKKSACYQSSQRFTPPMQWRWNPQGWGDGCELFINGTWYPADMVHPSLK
ncbi:MAG: hypothetical protein PHQ36_01720 [Anaerolineales bacterium]|nr:hypothetical protein [Anaerolineales bacterium]